VRRLLLTYAAALGGIAVRLPAQDSASLPALRRDWRGDQGAEVWAGVGFHSRDLGALGHARNIKLALSAVRWTRRVGGASTFRLEYIADVIPAAVAWPITASASDSSPGCQYCLGAGALLPAHAALGAGVSPLGFGIVAWPERRLQFSMGATAGVLWFDRPVPIPNAARLNFTAAAEAGVTAAIADRSRLALTYRFHHLSNAGLARENPGVASHLLSLGLRWTLGRQIGVP
jgi:hypothetical protein